MNIIDIMLALFLILGALLGFKEGVIKKTVSLVGLIVIIVVSFAFKNVLSELMYENLPFFSFFGKFRGIEILNILLYETIAFAVVFGILLLILKLLLFFTGIIEKILKLTIILAIPSKILGIVVGLLEAYLYSFVILFILTLPVFNIDAVNESKYGNIILNNTPVLTGYSKKTLDTYNEVYDIIISSDNEDIDVTNTRVVRIMLDKKVITVNSVKKLVEKGKIHIVDSSSIINEYEGKQ